MGRGGEWEGPEEREGFIKDEEEEMGRMIRKCPESENILYSKGRARGGREGDDRYVGLSRSGELYRGTEHAFACAGIEVSRNWPGLNRLVRER